MPKISTGAEVVFEAVKLQVWNKVMTDCGFTEGTAGTKDMLEEDGSTTHVTYNGSDTIKAVGTQNGQDVGMTLTKGSDGKIALNISDNSFQDQQENTESYDAEAAKAKYNEDRVDSFLEWNDGLDELTVSMAADKREIRATADNNELNIDNLKGESCTWNCSPSSRQKTLTMHNPSVYPNKTKTITVNRSNIVVINNYAIHNFSDGSDWYIVKYAGALNPSGQYHHDKPTGAADYVYGHTGHYRFFSAMDGNTTLIDTAPKNANKEQTKTVGLSMNLSGKIGVSDKGISGEIGGGISKTSSTSKDAQTYAFTILSEGNWFTETDSATASWCSLSETSGGPTNGDDEKQMMLHMTENNTGKIRKGEIKFKLNSNGLNEIHTLTVEQAPTSKIIN